MMRKVYVCAPLGGNVEQNLKKVKTYTEYALRCGTAPVVPHFYAECLDDNDPKDREIGLAAGLSLLWFCDELWLFGDTVTDGMKNELQFCKNLNIRILCDRICGGRCSESDREHMECRQRTDSDRGQQCGLSCLRYDPRHPFLREGRHGIFRLQKARAV